VSGFTRKVFFGGLLPQRRKVAKRYRVLKDFLCALAPLREMIPSVNIQIDDGDHFSFQSLDEQE
jgi:hypothetical protein